MLNAAVTLDTGYVFNRYEFIGMCSSVCISVLQQLDTGYVSIGMCSSVCVHRCVLIGMLQQLYHSLCLFKHTHFIHA